MATRRSKAQKKKADGFLGFVFGTIKFFLVIGCVVGAVGLGYVGASLWKQLADLPDITLVERYEPIEAIQLFDRNDHLICTVEGDEDRRVVPLNQVSAQMQQAMLAAEDHHFYEHHGVNLMSIGRAMLANLQAHKVVEGGSTITQQLVKNLFFTEGQRTYDRKIKEAFMAYELERRYAKERILEMYLNQVYFGNNAYGIERAASRYFDKTAAGLSLGESAFLAGLVKAPSELGNSVNRKGAISRQREILDKMVEYGYVTAGQAATAKKQKLAFKRGVNPMQRYPFYISYVLELLRDRFSQAEMRRQGLRVYTYLDPQAQELAEKTLEADIKKAPKGVSQAALVSVSVQDGSVLALVGGVGNFWKHQFNRATNQHTAGSSFKPFVYLTAFNRGILSPDSKVDDTPLIIHQPYGLPDYSPKNFDHKFMGHITVRRALALSRNVCSVRIAQQVGIDSVVETARQAGITTKLEPNLSLALGSSAVTPFDLAGAYATFARMGVSIKPQVLRKIENNRGQVVEVFEQKVDKVFNVEPVARLVDVLQDVVRYGTGTQAKLDDRPVAGKTGTADAGKDIWFAGFTPDLCTVVWGGNDENLPIEGHNVTGGVVMAKIWKDYMKAYYLAHPTQAGAFVPPSQPTMEEQEREKKNIDQLNASEKMASGSGKDGKSGLEIPKPASDPGLAPAMVPKTDDSVASTAPQTATDSGFKINGAAVGDPSHAAATPPQTPPPVAPDHTATAPPVAPEKAAETPPTAPTPGTAPAPVVAPAPAPILVPMPAPSIPPKASGEPSNRTYKSPWQESATPRLYPADSRPKYRPAQEKDDGHDD